MSVSPSVSNNCSKTVFSVHTVLKFEVYYTVLKVSKCLSAVDVWDVQILCNQFYWIAATCSLIDFMDYYYYY